MLERTEVIRYIDLHHTAGHEKNTAAVRSEHMAPPNYWGDIGYNLVIEADGTAGKGRDVKWAGAHDPGKAPGETYTMNQVAYSISHIGNFMEDTMSDVQFNSSIVECARVCKLYNIPATKERVRRHKDQYATDCPGDNFPYDQYIEALKKALSGGGEVTVKKVVIYFSAADASVALAVANSQGGIATFCRNGGASVHPDALAAEIKFNIGGPALNVPGEIYMSGNDAFDTIGVVVDKHREGKV